jgi:hypothetical protein
LTLKKLYKDLTLDWEASNLKFADLVRENNEFKKNFERRLGSMSEDTRKEEIKLINENARLKAKFDLYKHELLREIKLKDLLLERHEGYEEILKQELLMAKKILKSPTLHRKAQTGLNFDQTNMNSIRDGDRDMQVKRQANSEHRRSIMQQTFNVKVGSITPSKKHIQNASPRTESFSGIQVKDKHLASLNADSLILQNDRNVGLKIFNRI